MNIKSWFSDFKDNRNHDRNTKRLNSELEKRYYKPKSSDLIKILSEIEDKAGLSAYDIIPFLIKIKLMAPKGSMIEEGGGGSVTDQHRNDELFKELEQLEFIRIIENKLFSELQGQRYKTPTEECVLKVKLLPKGIDYLMEHKNKKKDKYYKNITTWLLVLASIIALPQAINSGIEVYTKIVQKDNGNEIKDDESSQKNSNEKTDLKSKNSRVTEMKAVIYNPAPERTKPIPETSKH
ncbi:hypothetical protein [Arenibacter latericius]|uniref:hypothetical protein n=1 Tax=Arenibacter latericius TaxID=86104 RepID=UPI0003F50176|nr:hypothetical protein [Arenibacter latericius]